MEVEVVRVWLGDPTDNGKFSGTAFFINENTLVTAKHVLRRYTEGYDIYISTLSDGSTLKIEKDNITPCEKDIAILKVKMGFVPPVINFIKEIKIGDEVEIKGFDENVNSSINKRFNQVSGYEGGEHHLYRLQNYIASGYSGSPAFIDNKLCGIVQARAKDKNLTYIIPISECCADFVENRLLNGNEEFLDEIVSEEDKPLKHALLRFPNGFESSESEYYIERREDQNCYTSLEVGERLIKIKAPQQFGKTSLIERIIVQSEKSHYIVDIHFKWLESYLLQNLRELLQYICSNISDELDIDEEDRLSQKKILNSTPNDGATRYLEKILESSDKDILLVIDDADKLFKYTDVSNDFFALIRSWNQKGQGRDKIWKKLKIILSHSTNGLLATRSINHSPFNIGLSINLKSFTKKEIKTLAEKHNISLSYEGLDKLFNYLGGHPYLNRLVFYYMLKNKETLDDVLGNFIYYKEHMDEYLKKLNKTPKYKEVLKDILENKKCQKIKNEECLILESLGLIKIISTKNAVFTSELYKDFFRKNL